MKTVLFCGGLGTRIRDYSENIPKAMIPIGGKPILWHLMSYYSQYGHKDFILCLGYKANVIKEFFLNYQPHIYADCVVSGFGSNVETLGDLQQDWPDPARAESDGNRTTFRMYIHRCPSCARIVRAALGLTG